MSTSKEDEYRQALRNFPPGTPATGGLYSSRDSSEGVFASTGPTDGGNLVAMIFLLQGVSVLLCWNTFLTAYDYFALTMQPGEAKPTFEFWFAIYFNMPCFAMNMLMIRYGPKIPITVRIVTCQIGYLAILLGTPFIGRAAQSGDITLKMVNTLIYLMVGTCGLLTGLMFPSMTGLAAAFPGKYMTAAMSGVGFGGIIVGIIRVATKATLPGDDAGIRHASLIYFFVCAATMVLAILSFFVMVRTPFAQYHMDKAGLGQKPSGDSSARASLLASTDSVLSEGAVGSPISYSRIFRKSFKIQASVALSFWITIGLFPGVATIITSRSHSLNDSGWFQVIIISLFLVFDFVGRSLPAVYIAFNAKNIWIPTVARLLFFPLFILCVKPALIKFDYAAYAIMTLFALSNGYICTLLNIFAPSLVDTHEKETAGLITIFSLNAGIIAGSFTGIGLSKIL